MKSYYKTKNDFYSSTLEDKIDTLLYTNAKALEEYLNMLISNKVNFSLEEIRERNIKIGSLYSGEAYYHEKNMYYDIIGFLIETELIINKKRKKIYGFRGIYFNSNDELIPINFDLGKSLNESHRIDNGLGDYVELDEELVSQKDIQKTIDENNIDINKYLKEVNLLLEENKYQQKDKEL